MAPPSGYYFEVGYLRTGADAANWVYTQLHNPGTESPTRWFTVPDNTYSSVMLVDNGPANLWWAYWWTGSQWYFLRYADLAAPSSAANEAMVEVGDITGNILWAPMDLTWWVQGVQCIGCNWYFQTNPPFSVDWVTTFPWCVQPYAAYYDFYEYRDSGSNCRYAP